MDMLRREGRALVWRGIYRDNERNLRSSLLIFPRIVWKLFENYPPAKK